MNPYIFYFTYFLLVLVQSIPAQIPTSIDSLERKLEQVEAADRFDILLKLSQVVQKNDPSQGKKYLLQASTLIDTITESVQLLNYYSALSRNKLYQHKYEESLELIQTCEAFTTHVPPEIAFQLFSTQGTCYYYQSQFERAIDAHLQALQICESKAWEEKKPEVFNNIAVVYLGMDDWEKAETYTQEALNLANQLSLDEEGSRARGNMAILYAEQGKFELAEKWFMEDLKFDQQRGDLFSVSKNYNNLGVLYDFQQRNEASLKSYQKGLEIAQEINDKASIALGYQNVGLSLSRLKRYPEAIKTLKKGLDMNRELGNREILLDGYYNISGVYESMGDFKTALEYHQQFVHLNDSVISENHKRNVSELEIKYETEKKQREILALSEQKLKVEAEFQEQKALLQKILAAFLLISLLGLGVFIIYRLRQKTIRQAALIQAINETQIEERTRIAQDLHDSLGASLALNKNRLESILSKHPGQLSDLQDSIEGLTETGDQLRQISHNLMPSELLKFGLISALQSHLDQLEGSELETELLSHGLEARLDKTTEVHLYRITQELIQNVLKHAKASSLSISLNKYPKYLSLILEDNGIGMDTGQKKLTGIGLTNIYRRVELLKGKLRIDTQVGRGTIFNIEIPV